MTTEERVLRLENAFATLSEMVAQEASRTDTVVQLVRDHDESMKAEAARTDTLLQLVHDHDTRSETQMTWINSLGARMEELAAAQANADTKIAALADAQIRTEETIARINATQANADTKIVALADAQIRTEEAIARTNEALASLTGRVDHLSETIERYISEGRNGQG